MKYAYIVDETREIIGWFDSDIHDDIPTPKVEVTVENWNLALEENHNYIDEDGITSFKDFRTDEQIAVDDQDRISVEAKRYLDDTDWYIVRKYETDKDIPQEILEKRAEYREQIA